MAYIIVWLRGAAKQLKRIEKVAVIKIVRAVGSLESEQLDALDIKKIKGFNGLFRIRIGNYRIVYCVKHDEKEYVICKVAHRKDIYQSLSDVPYS